jgi:hypothetical protein
MRIKRIIAAAAVLAVIAAPASAGSHPYQVAEAPSVWRNHQVATATLTCPYGGRLRHPSYGASNNVEVLSHGWRGASYRVVGRWKFGGSGTVDAWAVCS